MKKVIYLFVLVFVAIVLGTVILNRYHKKQVPLYPYCDPKKDTVMVKDGVLMICTSNKWKEKKKQPTLEEKIRTAIENLPATGGTVDVNELMKDFTLNLDIKNDALTICKISPWSKDECVSFSKSSGEELFYLKQWITTFIQLGHR